MIAFPKSHSEKQISEIDDFIHESSAFSFLSNNIWHLGLHAEDVIEYAVGFVVKN